MLAKDKILEIIEFPVDAFKDDSSQARGRPLDRLPTGGVPGQVHIHRGH